MYVNWIFSKKITTEKRSAWVALSAGNEAVRLETIHCRNAFEFCTCVREIDHYQAVYQATWFVSPLCILLINSSSFIYLILTDTSLMIDRLFFFLSSFSIVWWHFLCFVTQFCAWLCIQVTINRITTPLLRHIIYLRPSQTTLCQCQCRRRRILDSSRV